MYNVATAVSEVKLDEVTWSDICDKNEYTMFANGSTQTAGPMCRNMECE